MRGPARGSRPRKSTLGSIPVPTAGWISNRNLAMPNGAAGQGAQVLDNWFPTASSARLRRGLVRHATMPTGMQVKSLFSYTNGANQKLFAASDTGIWDVTNVSEPYSVIITPDYVNYLSPDGVDEAFGWDSIDPTSSLWTSTNGEWITIQFSTSGGAFLIGVNGVDEAFIYDGTTFEPLSITFPAPDIPDTSEFSFIWAYKQRIYFIEKNSLSAWYLPVDSIGGQVTELPLGGVFTRGGNLMWGSAWSLASGGDGGLSEQNTFCTTEGEIAIYQGLSPDDAPSWSKVGVYRVGTPMGKRAFIRAGGDLIVATTIGFIPLSKAIQMDFAALGLAAISASIADEWRDTIASMGSSGWICEFWGEGSMIIVAPPYETASDPSVFVVNSDTGAWCRFTNWTATSMEPFQGSLFMGRIDGRIQRAWSGGDDDGDAYTGVMIPLFTDVGSPGQRKIAKIARVVKRSRYPSEERITAVFDWDLSVPSAPDATIPPIGNEWGNAIWGQSIWGAEQSAYITEKWTSVGGSGYAMSVIVQVTSGSILPLDVEVVRMDFSYEVADIIS